MDLSQAAKELAKSLKSSPEFKELQNAKAIIDRNPTLRSHVETLERKQRELYDGNLSERQAEAKMAELQNTFRSLSQTPEISRYFMATEQFNGLVTRVYKSVSEFIDMDLR